MDLQMYAEDFLQCLVMCARKKVYAGRITACCSESKMLRMEQNGVLVFDFLMEMERVLNGHSLGKF